MPCIEVTQNQLDAYNAGRSIIKPKPVVKHYMAVRKLYHTEVMYFTTLDGVEQKGALMLVGSDPGWINDTRGDYQSEPHMYDCVEVPGPPKDYVS